MLFAVLIHVILTPYNIQSRLGKGKVQAQVFTVLSFWTNYTSAPLISFSQKQTFDHIQKPIISKVKIWEHRTSTMNTYKERKKFSFPHTLAIHLKSWHSLVYTILKYAWSSFMTLINLSSKNHPSKMSIICETSKKLVSIKGSQYLCKLFKQNATNVLKKTKKSKSNTSVSLPQFFHSGLSWCATSGGKSIVTIWGISKSSRKPVP